MKRGYILLILIIFSCSLVFANGSGNVAYIIKNRPDSGFLYIFNEMGLNVDLINSKKIYTTDFSSYDFIFIGDERFRNAADIPIGTFPSVIVNKHHGLEFGITNAGGISQLASNSVLEVKKNSDMIQVYTQENYGIGKPAIPYYYLPNKYKNSEMISIATTNIGYKPELGDVVAYSDVGQANKCFFGVRETKFWTDETKRLFKECVEFAMQGSPTHFVHDVGIVEDYTNSVNGIRDADLQRDAMGGVHLQHRVGQVQHSQVILRL